MPLKVRRVYTSALLVIFGFFTGSHAQTPAASPAPQQPVQQLPAAPTSGDVMRDRISRAKAFIAVRNYNAAIYELESIRRESNDAALQGVVYVLLTNSYLEQGDYKRARDLLNETYNLQKTTKPGASESYRAVAGQVVKSARDRAERYRALGLNVSDRTLPLEAVNDLEKMRETLETVITQNKEIGKDKGKTADAMALVEEASNSRSMLARDDYDARRWRDEVADTRETIASSRSVVLDASGTVPAQQATPEYVAVAKTETTAVNPPAVNPPASTQQPVATPTRPREVNTEEVKPADNVVAQNAKPIYVPSAPSEQPKQQPVQQQVVQQQQQPVQQQVQQPADVPAEGPMAVGALTPYAVSQTKPVYPPFARTQRTEGVVTVEVLVSETGEVTKIERSSGPSLLQSAAKDAIKRWKFRPFTRDGQPVKATGYVNFNFSL